MFNNSHSSFLPEPALPLAGSPCGQELARRGFLQRTDVLGVWRALERLPWGDPYLCLRAKQRLARALAIFVRVPSASQGPTCCCCWGLALTSLISGATRSLAHAVVWADGNFFLQALSLSSWQVKDLRAKSHPLSLKKLCRECPEEPGPRLY